MILKILTSQFLLDEDFSFGLVIEVEDMSPSAK